MIITFYLKIQVFDNLVTPSLHIKELLIRCMCGLIVRSIIR
jgi:hypothetical protein